MPLLNISIPQSSFTNKLYSIRYQSVQKLHHASLLSGNPKTTRLNYSHNSSETQLRRNPLVVRAVATLEQQPVATDKFTDKSNEKSADKEVDKAHLVSSEKLLVEDDRELLRRKRISKANKGRGAWNKGIKHSPETRQKIRERTRLAMSRPQVKMKLVKGIHNQTQETRLKIAASVRLTWDRKRFNRRMIARCHREWLNLIAEASRSGFCGEEELQWDSYNVINQQLGNEFREGIESRKETRGSSPGVRAPKSLEQRKKISEAIAAKWADPVYRDRVYSGIAKKSGKDPEVRDPEWGTKKKEPKKVKPVRNMLSDPKIRSQQAKLKSNSDLVKPPQARFKDPQARYKLEMIKSIRAQRAASDPKISETILKANILIGEAQRAAEALEVAAASSPLAAASLIETRKLIAEAMSYIKSVEMGSGGSPGTDLDKEDVVEGVTEIDQRCVNGTGPIETAKFGEGGLQVQANVNGTEHINISSSSSLSSSSTSILSSWSDLTLKTTKVKADGEKQDKGGKGKRWVCGRLVDVEDEDEEDGKEEEEEDEGQDDQ